MPYLARRVNIPVMVGEIVLGVVVGFANVGIRNWTGEDALAFDHESHVFFLSEIGLIFLLFLAGMEIDFNMIGERGLWPMLLTTGAFTGTFAIAFIATTFLGIQAPFFIALVIATTSLGVVIPVIRELGITKTEFGQDILLAAIIADFATMIMIPLAVGIQNPDQSLWISLAFIPILLIVMVGIYVLGGYFMWRWPEAMAKFFKKDDPNETGVRASFLFIMIFVVLTQFLGTEVILGAFLAGAGIAFVFRESGNLESKLFGFGYGFLIPLFFVRVGVDFANTVSEPGGLSGLALVPVLVGLTYLAKVAPSLALTRTHGLRRAASSGVLLAGGLSLAIAAAEIGSSTGIIDKGMSAAIIFFAIVMAILSPILFRYVLFGPKKEEEEVEEVFELVTLSGKPLEGGLHHGPEVEVIEEGDTEWVED